MFFSDKVFFTWSRNVSSLVNGYQLCKNPCALSLCTSELEFWWLYVITSDTIHLELNRRRENEQLLYAGHWHTPALGLSVVAFEITRIEFIWLLYVGDTSRLNLCEQSMLLCKN
jgi:hypothetical protein